MAQSKELKSIAQWVTPFSRFSLASCLTLSFSHRLWAEFPADLQNKKQVTIIVGKELKCYTLNAGLLCDKIPFFNAAFRGNFQEATSRTITLPEDDLEAFEKLSDWVHGGRIKCEHLCVEQNEQDWQDSNPAVHERFGKEHEILWWKLYIVAGRWNMAKVQVEKITRFKQRVDEVAALDDDHIISADTIRFVYENTFPGSTLHDVVMQEVIELYFSYMYTFMANAKMARKLLKGI